MGCVRNAVRSMAIVLCMASALAFSGCSTTGKIGQMSKFDITKASPEDIAEALQKDGRVAISGGALFETDSARLAPSASDLVTKVSDAMKKNPDLKVAVVGHTDNTGPFKHNLDLSRRRAKTMVDALEQRGIAPDRLTGVGVGPLSPAAENDTPEGRAENRRVELVLIN